MTAELKFQLALTEAKQSQLRAEHYSVRIETGVYKNRLVHKGGFNGPLRTEAELLVDEVATMNRHIRLAQDHIEYAKSILHEMQGG